MKTSEIYLKTMKFVWAKLLLGLATVVASVIILAICLGIASLFGEGAIFIGVCFWIAGTAIVSNLLNQYVGYLFKAGHVAVIATAVTTGSIPENQIETAKTMVKERFLTSNVYFAVDKLVSGAVKQIQNGLGKIDSIFGNIPGVSAIVSFAQIFVGIALGYVDECCLGYTFIKKEQGAFKSAADGVVIYFQNWKKLLKDAALMSFVVIVITILAWIIPFAVFGGIFAALSWPRWIAAILAILVALIIKSAFIDSYMMVKMMVSYMEVAPSTEITFDLYGKLCKLSGKFKSLFQKGEEETAARQTV